VIDSAELFPQALDVAVDGAIIHIDIVAVGGIHQLVAGFDEAGARGQRFEDHEFGDRQRDIAAPPLAAIPDHAVARRVHGQATAHDGFGAQIIAGFRHRVGRGTAIGRPPQHGPDAFDQQALAERLADIIVGAHGKAQRLVDLGVLRREEDHRHLALLAQALEHLHAVHARHLDVEHDQIGRILDQRPQRGIAIGIKPHRKAFGLQRDGYRGQDVAIIVDQRDGGGWRGGVFHHPPMWADGGRLARASPAATLAA
jgi:hypothetical protein